MLKFIYNTFELDLTYLKVTFNWKNPWVDADLNSEYSFPFDMHESQWAKIINLSSYNSISGSKEFKGILLRDGDFQKATLKFQEKKGSIVSVVLFVGLENFPNFDKKITEFTLDKFPVTNLKAYAESILHLGYPAVNCNFPAIHSDKYDPSSSDYRGFVCLNYYKDGAFVTNSLEPDTNLDLIKNIMQPLPNAFYVLKFGIEDAGYTLAGDVINIPDLKKTFAFRDGNYFSSIKTEKFPFHFKTDEYDLFGPVEHSSQTVIYTKSITITKKGTYTLLGDIYVLQKRWLRSGFGTGPIVGNQTELMVKIKLGTTDLVDFFRPITEPAPGIDIYPYDSMLKLPIDIDLDLNVGDILYLEVKEARRDIIPSPTPDYPEMSALDLIATRYKNSDNTPIISLQDLQEIDLARCLPDMSFSDYVNAIRLCKNLDFKINGSVVTMDFVKIDRSSSIDISKYDIEEPLQTFNDERSFELKYTDGKSNSNHQYDSIYIDNSGYKVNNYTVNKNVSEIAIDLLPLPILNRNGVNTAYSFDDESSKLRLVFYDHDIPDVYPACFKNYSFDLENMYLSFWQNWLTNRINSDSYEWNFIISIERYKLMMEKLLQFAYKNYHIFTEIEREHIDHLNYRITAKSETII